MMLSSLLPGLRDIRGPLAAGYLYLVCLWIWFNDDLDERRLTGPFADAYEIVTALRPAELFILVSIAAFLVGSLLDELRVQIGRVITARTPKVSFSSAGAAMVSQFVSHHIQTASANLARAGLRIDHDLVPVQPSSESVRRELDRIRDSLVGKHGDLLAEIDRSRSESDFRAAISIPLLLLIGTFATEAPLWGVGVVLVAGLSVQAIRLRRHYGDKLAQALEAGYATAPSVVVFDGGVSDAIEATHERAECERTMRDGSTASERAEAAAALLTLLIRDRNVAVALHRNDEEALRDRYRDDIRRAFFVGVRIEEGGFADRPSIDTCRWMISNSVLPADGEDAPALTEQQKWERDALRNVRRRVRDADQTSGAATS